MKKKKLNMSSEDKGESETAKEEAVVKSKKSPGVKVVNGRVYDSENGTTCHQCRQKTRDLAAECKNIKKDRQCTVKICEKCLLNRYGENVEEVARQLDWHCPKCRGICNCSLCMKKKGHKPTGTLARTLKSTGFSSVSAMLEVQGPDNVSRIKNAVGKISTPDEGQASVAPSKQGKENSCVKTSGADSNSEVLPKTSVEEKHKKVMKDNAVSEQSAIRQSDKKGDAKTGNESQIGHLDVILPQGSEITEVAGVNLPPEDVGNALQFLEFCATFGEIIGITNGQPECVLRDIMGGRGNRRGKYSSAVQFNIQLLSLLQQDLGEESPLSPADGKDSWLNALKSCLSQSKCYLKDIAERIVKSNEGYSMLDCSQKLKLLTFLCDEVLGTMKIRTWIDEQNLKFPEKLKEATEKYVAAKEKEKKIKKKMQDQMAKALNEKDEALVAISKHESISKIKAEASKAHADTTDALRLVPKRKQRSDAMRTDPILCDTKDRVYWRLKGYSNSSMMLQVCDYEDQVTLSEKWFSLDSEEEKLIETYLPVLRVKRRRRSKGAEAPNGENTDTDSDS